MIKIETTKNQLRRVKTCFNCKKIGCEYIQYVVYKDEVQEDLVYVCTEFNLRVDPDMICDLHEEDEN